MRQINIVLDLYSGAICLILFCYLCFGRGNRDGMRRRFLLMCAFNFGMAVGDIPNWACEGLVGHARFERDGGWVAGLPLS